jgi:hypothetical protein
MTVDRLKSYMTMVALMGFNTVLLYMEVRRLNRVTYHLSAQAAERRGGSDCCGCVDGWLRCNSTGVPEGCVVHGGQGSRRRGCGQKCRI